MTDDCVFCKIAEKQIPAKVVYEDDLFLAFEDLDPKAPLHLLFIPKKHISTLNDISERDIDLAGRMLKAVSSVAVSKGIGETGYRVVINCNRDGGQEVFHLHFHLLGGRAFGWPPG